MRFPQVRPAVSLAAGGFLVVSASSFGVVTAVTSASQPGAPALRQAGPAAAAPAVAQAQTSAVSGASAKQCEALNSSSGSSPSPSPSPSASKTTSASGTPSPSPSKTAGTSPGTVTTPSTNPSPTTTPTTTSPTVSPTDSTSDSSSASASASASDSTSAAATATSTPTASTSDVVTRDGGGTPIAATLLGLTQSDAASKIVDLCVSLQRDEASVARGHSAQWNVSVWATGGNVANVVLQLVTSPSSQKPKFTFGCSKEGTNSCSLGTADSGSQHTQLQAQVPVAATAASVHSVKLTVTGKGKSVKTYPKASVPIGVTAPTAASSTAGAGSASHPTPGTGVLTPAGVRSTLGVGGLPFVSATGARAALQPTLSPGGNASSLFPTLNPSGNSAQGGTSRIRSLADSLPGDASLMGAQYAGLVALALAFILSVTRFSIRRRQAAAGQSPAVPKA